MIRESIDLATRECSAVTRFLSWNADVITSTTRTQNTRRRQIVPATPSCLRLKETAIQAAKALNGCYAEAWTRDDVSSDEMLPVLEKLFVPGHAEKLSVAAKKGTSLAVEGEPGVGLRSGLRWAQK
jgi:hypothetical protein